VVTRRPSTGAAKAQDPDRWSGKRLDEDGRESTRSSPSDSKIARRDLSSQGGSSWRVHALGRDSRNARGVKRPRRWVGRLHATTASGQVVVRNAAQTCPQGCDSSLRRFELFLERPQLIPIAGFGRRACEGDETGVSRPTPKHTDIAFD